jgi:uncharacterized membrane protein
LETHRSIDNPVAIEGAVGSAVEIVGKVGMFLVLVSLVFAAVSLINRVVLARGDERQQIKWFAFAAALTLVWMLVFAIVLGELLSAEGRLPQVIAALSGLLVIPSIPIATGVPRAMRVVL